MGNHKIFETERLLLVPISVQDAEFIYELFNLPAFIENIAERNIKSVEMAKEYISNNMLPQLEKLGYSTYTIVTKNDHTKVGTCGLYDRDGLEGIDIGYALLTNFEKRGYAFEAAEKLKTLAFTEFGLERLSAITSKNNLVSQKLLGKLGLTLTGTTKLPTSEEELFLFQIKKESLVK